MRIEDDIKIDFSDVLLRPKRSTLNSRKEVDINRQFIRFPHAKIQFNCVPIIAANMDTVGTFEMAKSLAKENVLTALHKHYSIKELSDFAKLNPNVASKCFYSTGIQDKDHTKLLEARELIKKNYIGICVDVANGYSQGFIEYIQKVRAEFPDILLMAGNIVTGEMTEECILKGVDIVKVGIGPGCFAAGTKVLMANGTYKPIETIIKGDRVINKHGKAVNVLRSFCTGKREILEVKQPYWPTPTLVTPDHQFWVEKLTHFSPPNQKASKYNWISIGNCNKDKTVALMPNNIYFESPVSTDQEDTYFKNKPSLPYKENSNYQIIPFTYMKQTNKVVSVYDIEVECPTHSFIANNMIVHNSACTTRKMTGIGYPQLSAIIECSDAAHGLKGHICGDGGCICPGDISKGFAGGADFMMLGGMLSAHEESGGELVEENGMKFKYYYGMSSSTAMKKYSGKVAEYRASEGKTVKIPYRGPVSTTLQSILGGLRSTCTYTGSESLKELPKRATFIRVNRQLNTVFGDISSFNS